MKNLYRKNTKNIQEGDVVTVRMVHTGSLPIYTGVVVRTYLPEENTEYDYSDIQVVIDTNSCGIKVYPLRYVNHIIH